MGADGKKRRRWSDPIDARWESIRAWCNKRRNSYKLYLYYVAKCVLNVILFVVAITFYNVVWNEIRTTTLACDLTEGMKLKTESDVINEIRHRNESISCENQVSSLSACTLGDVRSILNAIMASGIISGLQMLVCLALSMAYYMFSNVTKKELQYHKTKEGCCSCQIKMDALDFLGFLCKQAPWADKLFHVVQGLLVLVYGSLILSQRCKGDMLQTHACANYQKTCIYNKLRNCQYLYHQCRPSISREALDVGLMNCFEPNKDDIKHLSGLMDVRLVTDDNCTRCVLLEQDVKFKQEDEFRLLREGDKSLCKQDEKCFYADISTWKKICTSCHETVDRILQNGCKGVEATSNSVFNAATWSGSSGLQPGTETPAAGSRRMNALSSTALDKQECSWGPQQEKAYYFSTIQCEQYGSYVYRFCNLYAYLVGYSWMLQTVAGQAGRLLSNPEPWFANPRMADEGIAFRLLRIWGP